MAVQPSDALAAAGADPTVPITSVRVLYSDLHGIARGKDVPVQEFDRMAEQGLAFCSAIMGTDLRHTPVVGGEEGYPDFHAHPDVSTLRCLPWEPGVACCMADLTSAHPGTAVVDARGALKNVAADLETLGLTPIVGPELEFFLLVPDASAPGGVRRVVDQLSMVYTVGPQVDPGGTVRRMAECLAEVGLGAFAMNHEFFNSQYEINQLHCGAVEAADRAFRLKAHVKDMAAQAGLVATFMGKPFNDQGGSGLHLHLSLQRDGENALGDPAGADGVGEELRHFVGGILAHATGAMALLNPTVNAYRRLVPDSLAPTQANWGWDNRSTFVRIPPERGPATRIEVRVGDGGANPYLATAALLAAGAHGLRERIEPPAPVSGDAYSLEQSDATRLPHCLEDALDALDGDTVLRAALGAPLVDTFLAMKRFEVDRHRAWTSDWEIEEYLHHL